MGNRSATLLFLVVVVAVGWLTWWLEDRFGSVAALAALLVIFFFLVIVVVWQMAKGQSRETMELLIDFGQKDAMTDRFRSQTTLEATRSVTVAGAHGARLALLDAQEERARRRQEWRLMNQRQLPGPEVDPYAQPGDPAPHYAPRVVGRVDESYKEFD